MFVLVLFTLVGSSASSQDVTGIWKGYFITESGQYYRLEFQVAQNSSIGVTGVSYSYLDIRFYGKATMTGSFVKSTSTFRIREIKTVEVKSSMGGATCIMNYDFKYSRSGKEEYLEGTYLGKYESKFSATTGTWGDCGNGRVFLRRVENSDFYIEPFLKNKIKNRPVIDNEPPRKKDTVRTNPTVKKDTAKIRPTTKSTVKKPVEKPVLNPAKKEVNKPVITVTPKKDSVVKITAPVTKPVVPTPPDLKNRSNEVVKILTVKDPRVTVKIYDNGEIDGDTISVYLDKKLVLSEKRLTASPLVVSFDMDEDNDIHEITMVAENLGTIPPNTSLMIVESGEQRFEVRITSTEQKNAVVRFKYQKPDR